MINRLTKHHFYCEGEMPANQHFQSQLGRTGARLAPLALAVCAAFVSVQAHAFVDQRSQQQEPAAAAPAAPVAAHKAPEKKAVKTSAPVAKKRIAQSSDVRGDLSAPAWDEAYPGPFGQMSIASALIAQVVPVVGGTVQFAGPADLLSRTTYVSHGATRLDVLQTAVKTANVAVDLKGNVITLSSTGEAPVSAATPAQALPAASATPEQMAQMAQSAEPVAIKKIWNLTPGAMLSSELTAWAKQWGWNLVWNADMDYRIATPVTINDTFLGGVQQILDAYRDSERPLWGDFNDKQQVLVISEPDTSRISAN